MTIHVTDRKWDGPRKGERRARGAKRTKHDGYNQRTRVWVCKACKRLNLAETREGVAGEDHRHIIRPRRPLRCQYKPCKHGEFWYCASMKEATRLVDLIRALGSGHIHDLKFQPRFPITVWDGTRPIDVMEYWADFSYRERPGGPLIVEDVKPKDSAAHDPVFELKQRLVETQYHLTIRLVG